MTHSSELGSMPDFTYLLTQEDKAALANQASDENLRQPRESVSAYALRLESGPQLPEDLGYVVSDFASKGNDFGALLLRGFEVDIDGPESERAQAFGEFSLLSVAARIGRPYGYASQRNGEIIQNLTPKPEDEFKQLGTGSQTVLEWHTEDAHTPLNCDVISLLCLRGAEDAATLVSQIQPSDLDPEVRRILETPSYRISSDGSYQNTSELTTPVLCETERGWTVRYDPLYTECATPKARVALDMLTEYINTKAVSIVLAKGDLLLIDNHTSVHARSTFTPRYDGKDRWLQRAGVLSKEVLPQFVTTDDQLVINI